VIELREATSPAGVSYFAKWRAKLDPQVRSRIATALLRLSHGNLSAAKGVGFGVLELRLDFGPGYRVYFAKDGETIFILLGGGTKHRQQADIEVAQTRWQEYKRDKGK
jgi:putative addiction module killer protein